MSKLVIVESPAKAKTIGKYLGADYVVKASMGHLRDLPKKKMSIDLEHDFKPEYVPIEGKDKVIKEIRSEIRKADFVYLATDPDREGTRSPSRLSARASQVRATSTSIWSTRSRRAVSSTVS